jgi:hypothetical protein
MATPPATTLTPGRVPSAWGFCDRPYRSTTGLRISHRMRTLGVRRHLHRCRQLACAALISTTAVGATAKGTSPIRIPAAFLTKTRQECARVRFFDRSLASCAACRMAASLSGNSSPLASAMQTPSSIWKKYLILGKARRAGLFPPSDKNQGGVGCLGSCSQSCARSASEQF